MSRSLLKKPGLFFLLMVFAAACGPQACREDSDRGAGVPAAQGEKGGQAATKPKTQDLQEKLAVSKEPGILHDWNPKSGRGAVAVHTRAGDRAIIRLHDGFEGYTGGLVLGSINRPSYALWPKGRSMDEKPLAVFCAQDESIWLPETNTEVSYGWSENFGRGPDGAVLRYVGGAVLEESPEMLVLASVNASPPFELVRWIAVDLTGTVAVRLQIRNRGSEPVFFDLFTGDDPWVGEYGTSRNDVGWTAEGFVEREAVFELAPGGCAGIADQNPSSDRTLGNFTCLFEGTEAPSFAAFANAFAHDEKEIAPGRPLAADTMTALNIGWAGQTLEPGGTFEIGYALGYAFSKEKGGLPSPPRVDDALWKKLSGLDRAKLPELDKAEDPLRFASEKVVMSVAASGKEVEIEGRYDFVNTSDKALYRRIYFPFHVDEAHPYPTKISVSTGMPQRVREGIVFSLKMEANEKRAVRIRYTQESADASATYIVTSARSWSRPLDLAELEVRAALGIAVKDISYPMEKATTGGGEHWKTRIERFFPDREFSVRWEKR